MYRVFLDYGRRVLELWREMSFECGKVGLVRDVVFESCSVIKMSMRELGKVRLFKIE